ncbi:PREDICTED: uncharacterized protein LOC107119720 [Gekko japonicus]|uniref:Uncharacterized protein LOC107119720 n=1 Tax=Gekko japonicus TaxID=146911 RepID=A0ABM1KVP2_GEKJA|nr:PREDICTED: uncharacterized protein LOC107119720 [Gekko japonicus]
MAAAPGHFDAFYATIEDWDSYISRFKFFLESFLFSSTLLRYHPDKALVLRPRERGREGQQRTSEFLICLGILKKLILHPPADITTVAFKELTDKLKAHFSPQPSEIASRHAFFKRSQAPNETMAEYVAALRKAARPCNFTDVEEALRDRLVCGMRDERLQQLHPTDDKVKAIKEAPRPCNKKELQSFLGLLNFYHTFLPHKASVAAPLHALLHKDVKWRWGPEQERAFEGVKALLSSEAVLTHYDDQKLLVLAADASPFGVGAVLSHVMEDGREAPVAFYSRSLSDTEKNYAQIDKEGLALVSAVKKFHDFLFGRRFILVTDHKPLLGIFAPDRQLPNIMSARMLRWALFLSAYDYDLEHRPGKAIGHADGQMFLVIVDAYTKWLEVVHMHSTTSGAVINVLRHLFATHGLPDVLLKVNW